MLSISVSNCSLCSSWYLSIFSSTNSNNSFNSLSLAITHAAIFFLFFCIFLNFSLIVKSVIKSESHHNSSVMIDSSENMEFSTISFFLLLISFSICFNKSGTEFKLLLLLIISKNAFFTISISSSEDASLSHSFNFLDVQLYSIGLSRIRSIIFISSSLHSFETLLLSIDMEVVHNESITDFFVWFIALLTFIFFISKDHCTVSSSEFKFVFRISNFQSDLNKRISQSGKIVTSDTHAIVLISCTTGGLLLNIFLWSNICKLEFHSESSLTTNNKFCFGSNVIFLISHKPRSMASSSLWDMISLFVILSLVFIKVDLYI